MVVRRCAFLPPLLVAALSTAHAQALDHWRHLVGNWQLEFHKDGARIATGEFAFHPGAVDGTHGKAGGLVTEAGSNPRPLPYTCTGTIEGATVRLGCGTYGFTHHLNYVTLQAGPDGHTLLGTWSTNAGEREGATRWTRVKPLIRSVDVVTDKDGSLDFNELKRKWDYGGAPPTMRVRLRGEAMPLWIDVYAQPHIVVAIDDPSYRLGRDSLSVNDLRRRWEQGVMEYPVHVLPGAKAGRKTITVNGSSAPFDVVFHGTLEGGAKDLRP